MLNIYAFAKGIRIEPVSSSNASREGEIEVINGKLRVHDGSVSRELVSLDQTQSLTNKTLNNTNTVSLLDTLFTLQDDADNTKQLRFQLSGITTGTTRTLTVPDVNDTLVTLAALQTLTNKTLTSPIITNPTITGGSISGLTITALDANVTFQDDIDPTKQMRFQLSGISTGQTRTLTVPDITDTLVTLTASQVLSNKSLTNTGDINFNARIIGDAELDNTTSGLNATSPTPSKVIRRYTGSISSLDGVTAPSGSARQLFILTNETGSSFVVNNDTGATAANRILTGTGANLTLAANSSLILYYSTDLSRWMVVGGSGSGGGATISLTAGENLALGDAVYVSIGAGDGGRTAGRAYKLDATNDLRMEFIGIVQAASSTGSPVTIQQAGQFTGLSGLATGEPVFASVTTPGGRQTSAPVTAGQWIIQLGIAVSSTDMSINSAGSAVAIKISSGGMGAFVNRTTKTVDYTATANDDVILCDASSGNITISLPAASGHDGKIMHIKKIDSSSNLVIIDPNGVETIDTALEQTLINPNDSYTVVCDGSSWLII
jgi:hypothetical protein